MIASPARRLPRRPALGRLAGQNHEGILVVCIVILSIVVGFAAPEFWSLSTLLNVTGASIDDTVFALGVLLVLVSGGIDVSFMAIGIFAAYSTVLATQHAGAGSTTVLVPFAIAAGIGLALGGLNALVVAGLRLPTLIATLGTQGIIRGVLLSYIGSRLISDLPPSAESLSTSYLVTAHGAHTTPLSILVVPAAILCVLVALLLRYTLVGRGIYAIGGDEESARRAGFPVVRIKVIVYTLAGMLAGIAGLMQVTMVREADPSALVGGELDVIAAVVIGGASIFGGRGSVTGTVLGVLLISLINNCLILLGIPSTWQRAAVGLMLLIGIAAQAMSAQRQRRSAAPLEVPA
jgi:simple sugar transport system permease protein